jgi:hypothetical protein
MGMKEKAFIIKSPAHWKRLRKSRRWQGFPEFLLKDGFPYFAHIDKRGKIGGCLHNAASISLLANAAFDAGLLIWGDK